MPPEVDEFANRSARRIVDDAAHERLRVREGLRDDDPVHQAGDLVDQRLFLALFDDQPADRPEDAEYRKPRKYRDAGANCQRRICIFEQAHLQGENDEIGRGENCDPLDVAPLRLARAAACVGCKQSFHSVFG